MSSHNVDEMYVKVGVDTSEYDKKVEELSQSNEKLAEGLEDTEKQFEKTSKSSRENSKDIKNVTGEYQKLATGLGNVLSSLARFGAAAIAGTGIAAYTDKVAKMNLAIADSAKLRNEDYQTMIKWKYASSELRANPEAFQQEMLKVKDGINALNETGEAGMLQYFTEFGIEILDDELKARKIEDLLLDLSFAIDNKENKERVHLLGREYGLEEITNAFLLNSHRDVLEARARQEKKFVFSDKDLENLSEFDKNMTELKNHFNSLSNSVTANLVPALKKAQEAAIVFFEYLQKNPEVASALGIGAVAVGTVGVGAVLKKALGPRSSSSGPFKNPQEVYKVFVTNMDGEGGVGGGEGRRSGAASGLNKHLGAVTLAQNIQFAAEAYLKDKDKQEDPKLKESLLTKHKEEDYRRWMKAQGYAYFDRNPSKKSAEELQKISLIGAMGDEYGTDNILDLIKSNTSYLDRGMLGEVAPLKLEDVVKVFNENADKLNEIKETNKGLKSGNDLTKASNDWLKKISESPSLKSLDSVLRKVLSEADTNTYIEGVGHLMPGGVISGGREDRKKAAMQYFMRMGWTKEQAAGIVANLDRESGLDPRAVNPNETDSKGNKFSSYGIAQWNRERLDLFKRKFGKHVKDASFEEQLAFVQYELENTHHRARKALKSSDSVASSTEAITRHYEVPANMDQEISKRQAIARDLVGVDFNAWSNSLRIPNSRNTPAQAVASNSNIEVSIGDVMVQTTAETLSGVGQDMSEAIKARMTLGQLTTGAV